MTKAAFIAAPQTMTTVFGNGRFEAIAARAELCAEPIAPDHVTTELKRLRDVEVLFSTWGMPALSSEQLEGMPRLRIVFYAAGSVQGFARPLLERGIRVVSAWRANAEAVAQYTLAQILLGAKGYFRNIREYTDAASFRSAYRGPGAYDETVALLGFGAIGRRVAALLKPFDLNVIVFDPFLTESGAQEAGVESVTLAQAFERGYVVSNHLADKPQTAGMITGGLLNRMQSGAVFINTGRGRTVAETEMVEVLRQRPDLTALLDVTWPEPAGEDSPLRTLPNLLLSSHIAGAIHQEVFRLADLCIAELDRYLRGEPLQHEVTTDMLTTMA
jgi:phosphoglycerate dehydrogenase-like enzyme